MGDELKITPTKIPISTEHMVLNVEEVTAILQELEFTYINLKDNIVAYNVVRRMIRFRDNNVANRDSKTT
jgi:hypothetical protein